MKRMLALLLVLGLLAAGCTKDKPGQSATQTSVSSQGAVQAPVPQADNAPIPRGEVLPTGNQECVLNLNPPGTGISMRDSLNIQGNADVICKAQPTLLWVSMRLQMQNPKGGWDDEDDVLLDPHPPAPRTINGVIYWMRNYNRWATCFPGWWKVIISWNGIKNTAGASKPETFGADNVPAAPYRTSCTM